MSTGTPDLWLSTVPRRLGRDPEALDALFERLAEATADIEFPIVAHIVTELRSYTDSDLTFQLAHLVAGYDVLERGEARPSHRALGWATLAAARGHATARTVVTLAHLTDLRDLVSRNPEIDVLHDAEASHALWYAYRCADRTEADDLVRPLMRSVLAGQFDREDLADVIVALAKEIDDVEIFVSVDPEEAPARSGDMATAPATEVPSVQVLAEIGDPASTEGRRLQRAYGDLLQPLALRGFRIDPDRFSDILTTLFPWLSPIISAAADDLRLQHLGGQPGLTLRPLLIEGPPGTGKSYLAERIANVLGMPVFSMDTGGHSDNRALAGTARGWSSAQPAFPIHCMKQARAANPMILIDEIDKAVTSHNGSIHGTLLGMLDRRTAKAWPDECLMAPCDLSHVSWMLTCNDASRLPRALRSRVRHVRVQPPGEEFADHALSAVALDVRTQLQWEPSRPLPVPDQVWRELRAAIVEGTDLRRAAGALLIAMANGPRRPQRVH